LTVAEHPGIFLAAQVNEQGGLSSLRRTLFHVMAFTYRKHPFDEPVYQFWTKTPEGKPYRVYMMASAISFSTLLPTVKTYLDTMEQT
jgi:hypothetical protein